MKNEIIFHTVADTMEKPLGEANSVKGSWSEKISQN